MHLVDLDSDEHDLGPFNVSSRAIVERTDALIGEMMQALPPDYDIVITADHGFERVDHTANLNVLLEQHGLTGKVRTLGGLAVTDDPAVASFLREESAARKDGVGRVVPPDELAKYAPSLKGVLLAVAPAGHYMFGMGAIPPPAGAATHDRPEAAKPAVPQYLTPPYEKGNHGFWPVRDDYSSVFILAGPGVKAEHLGRIEMVSLENRMAAVLGLSCK